MTKMHHAQSKMNRGETNKQTDLQQQLP